MAVVCRSNLSWARNPIAWPYLGSPWSPWVHVIDALCSSVGRELARAPSVQSEVGDTPPKLLLAETLTFLAMRPDERPQALFGGVVS